MALSYFDESFESLGYWWTPGHMEDARPGYLRYDPARGIRLTLLGPFKPQSVKSFPESPRYPILLGRVTSSPLDTFVTLTDCTYAGGRGVFFSIGTEEFTVNRAYFGAHLEGDDAFRFDAATLFLDYLEHWATESALEMSVEFEHDIPVKHEVRYGKKEMPRAVVGPRTVELDLLRELPLDLTRTVTLSETPCFNVRFESAEHVDTILRDTIFPLQNLSSLASDHRTRIRGLQLSRGAAGNATRVHLLFQQIPGPTGPVPKRLWAEQMLVTSRDVPMERLLTAWLPFAAEHRDLCDLYFSVMYSPTLLSDAAFFMLAQVAEGYHRDQIGGTEQPDDAFQSTRSAVVAAAPQEHQKWLDRKLGLANELSLKTRLHALVKPDRATLKAIFGDTAAFVDLAADTRNYMAHRIVELQKKAATGITLHQLTERLRLLVKACFLRELGLTSDERRTILTRHVTFDRIVRAPQSSPRKQTRTKSSAPAHEKTSVGPRRGK